MQNQPPAGSPNGNLAAITWPLMLTMKLMLLLGMASIRTLSSLRPYVNGEGRWSKAESQAIADLRRYTGSGDASDYQKLRQQLSVPLGDRAARLALESADPDSDIARLGFLAGGNDPADVPGMILLFRLFSTSSIMLPSVRAWTNGDALIMQLSDIGKGALRPDAAGGSLGHCAGMPGAGGIAGQRPPAAGLHDQSLRRLGQRSEPGGLHQ
jgi:hypothetical protein